MDTIEARLSSIRQAALEEGTDSDKVGLAIHYLRDKFENGYKFGGITWVPCKKGKTVTSWKLRLSIWRPADDGTLEEIHRDL